MNASPHATVVGGGLAGSEAAWALAERGVRVTLHEMRPVVPTPAHRIDRLVEGSTGGKDVVDDEHTLAG